MSVAGLEEGNLLPTSPGSIRRSAVQVVVTVGLSLAALAIFGFTILQRVPEGVGGSPTLNKEVVQQRTSIMASGASKDRHLVFVVESDEDASAMRTALAAEERIKLLLGESQRETEILVASAAARPAILQAIFDQGSFVSPSGALPVEAIVVSHPMGSLQTNSR